MISMGVMGGSHLHVSCQHGIHGRRIIAAILPVQACMCCLFRYLGDERFQLALSVGLGMNIMGGDQFRQQHTPEAANGTTGPSGASASPEQPPATPAKPEAAKAAPEVGACSVQYGFTNQHLWLTCSFTEVRHKRH